jgi:large subunit ribosomal protein L22
MDITATATQKFLRLTPRKMRIVANAVRGRQVDDSLKLLKVMPQKAAVIVHKAVTQAKANAVSCKQADSKTLKIETIEVMEGPRLKRFQAVSRGRAHSIIKRLSHVKVTVKGSTL